MSITAERPKAYLIVAYYNRQKWNNLSPAQREAAEKTAENLFPEGEKSKPLNDLERQGEYLPHTFDSDLFVKIPNYRTQPRDVREILVDGIYATQQLEVPVGWMVIVDEQYFASYLGRMHGETDDLWRLYDIAIYPLDAGWIDAEVLGRLPPVRPDQTTQNIYDDMTPTSWGH